MTNALVSSTRNQLGNAHNSFQGAAHRVLCVCSAGLLRSPTAAKVLSEEYGYNTRACGASREFALIPISEALVHWAQEIVFVNGTNFWEISEDQGFRKYAAGKDVVILDIPDMFEYCEEGLIREILHQYPEAKRITM